MTQAARDYQKKRQGHWDGIAIGRDRLPRWGAYYHRRLEEVYRLLIPPGQKVLEIGCGIGNLLASLRPSLGVGADFSREMLTEAARLHPELRFVQCDAHHLPLHQSFDVIILSDTVNDLWDVQAVFREIARISRPRTRIILNFYSHLWELPLVGAQKLGMMMPTLPQNWLTAADVVNLLNLTDFEVIRHWPEILWPVRTPLVDRFFNVFMGKLWPLHYFSLTNLIVAKPKGADLAESDPNPEPRLVSVIVPARNEAGNIPRIFERVPEMGRGTELIFVEGGSSDDTYAAIEKAMKAHPERPCRLFRQTGKGKGDAVRLGFSQAKGEILMILDADMTVPPEDLPRFYDALVSGKGEFINGVRLVYPMEKQAMRYLNLVGNKFFSLAFSWLLGQPIKDTLCGTKVLRKGDYERIAANRHYFGDFDPFGDFDLLFGAAKLNLKIAEMPIRYAERTYGDTNINRWKHGWLLLRMVFFALRRIKFV